MATSSERPFPAASSSSSRGAIRALKLALRVTALVVAAIWITSAWPTPVHAAVFAVTTNADAGPGSLRDAIIAANGAPGPDVIQFSIGGGGPQTITPLSPLPAITDTVVIDGTSQPGYAGSPLIQLDGSAAGIANGLSFVAGASNSSVIGLDVVRFAASAISTNTAGGLVIIANYLGTDPGGGIAAGNGAGVTIIGSGLNHVGGVGAASRNLISANQVGVIITGNSPSNEILGNYIGTDVGGMVALGNVKDGVLVHTAEDTHIGNNAGGGNVISGNGQNGVEFDDTQAIGIPGNSVEGNLIGTNATGTAALGNGGDGVRIGPLSAGGHANDNFIGGVTATSGNLISGNGGSGVAVDGALGAATNNVVTYNMIGTDSAGGVALPNVDAGVSISSANGNFVGTAPAGAGPNTIAGNTGPGVLLDSGAANNTIVDNVIGGVIGNTGDGVLVTGGSSANKIGTPGGGANTIKANGANGVEVASGVSDSIRTNAITQNASNGILLAPGANNVPPEAAPLITNATTGIFTLVQGDLVSTPLTAFTIEVFNSPSCGPGNGQGETFLGSIPVVTNAVGFVAFSSAFAPTAVGSVITATATDPAGNTSQFSNCHAVAAATGDSDNDGCPDAQEGGLSPRTDPLNPWDFYSVPTPALFAAPNPLMDFRDGTVSAGDAQSVFAYFKAGAKVGQMLYDQDLNGNGVPDGVEYDRSVVGPGQSGRPDGVVSASDSQLAFAQFKLGYHCTPSAAAAVACVYASDGLASSTLQVACAATGASAPPVFGWGVTLAATPLSAHCVQNFGPWAFVFYPGLEVGCADPSFAAVPFVVGDFSCGTITNIYSIPALGPAITVDLFTFGKVLTGTVTVASTTFPIPGC